ncbi:hypothetical protein VE03_04202 [Pseudogymnoascus sp. 23342-1-I1]|nr:hypothetical protein VE03_04202 [Pseudogymnoascus sp. 23342-1-I1]
MSSSQLLLITIMEHMQALRRRIRRLQSNVREPSALTRRYYSNEAYAAGIQRQAAQVVRRCVVLMEIAAAIARNEVIIEMEEEHWWDETQFYYYDRQRTDRRFHFGEFVRCIPSRPQDN